MSTVTLSTQFCSRFHYWTVFLLHNNSYICGYNNRVTVIIYSKNKHKHKLFEIIDDVTLRSSWHYSKQRPQTPESHHRRGFHSSVGLLSKATYQRWTLSFHSGYVDSVGCCHRPQLESKTNKRFVSMKVVPTLLN